MKKRIALLMAAAMLVTSLAGCSGGTGAETSSSAAEGSGQQTEENGDSSETSGRTDVVIRVESPWSTFNPLDSSLYVEYYELNQMYETLVWVDDEGNTVPVLAESWESNSEGNEYTIKIREGVKFHNGEELKASDVAFVLTKAAESPALKSNLGTFQKAEAVDDYTVKITLEAPFAPLIPFLANIKIFNEKFYNEHNGDLRTVECGTGPYKLVDVDMDTEMNLTAFEDYWQGPPAIKDIKFTVITDETTAAVAYMAGEVDFISTAASQYLEISAQPDLYSFEAVPTKHTALFYFNTERAPFDNKLVRKALQHAVDRDTMIQVAFEGFASPAYLQGDESCFGVDYDRVVMYDYDLDKAKEELERSNTLCPNPWALYAIGQLIQISNHSPEGAKYTYGAARLFPENPSLAIAAAKHFYTKKLYKELKEFTEQIPDKLKRLPRIRFYHAFAAAERGNTQEAKELLADESFEIPDMKEGETVMQELWYRVHEIEAKKRGETFDRATAEPPMHIDFDMYRPR